MSIALLRDMAFGLALPRYSMAIPSEGVTDSFCIGRPLVSFRTESKCKKKLTLSKSRSVVFSNMGDSNDTYSSSSSSSSLGIKQDELVEARKSLSEARAKQEAVEKERDSLLEESGAKQKEYAAAISAISKLEAAKSSFDRRLQESVEERLSLESKLVLARQDAVELAVQVEKLAEIAFRRATSHILEDAKMRVSAAETSSAEAALEAERRIKDAADGAAASIASRSEDAIRKALDAAEKAVSVLTEGGSSRVVDIVSRLETENAKLRSAVSELESRVSVLRNEADALRSEVGRGEKRAMALEIRADDAERELAEFRRSSEERALRREEEVRSLTEGMEREAEERRRVAGETFAEELRSIGSAVGAAREAARSRDEAFARRCEALQRSLKASEEVSKSWRQRAGLAESLLFEGNPLAGADKDSIFVVNGGRLDLLTGDDPMKWKLLSEGPRREIPQWRARRIRTIRPKFPPRKTDVTEALNSKFRTLELPKADEVWSVAKEKLKEGDSLVEHVIEKETIEKKRKALERALQEKSVQRKRAPEQLEPGTGTGREIVFQAFNWESWRKPWYRDLASKAADLSQSGVTAVWLPPPTESVAPQGYMPSDLYNLNSAYGTVEELKHCIEEMHSQDILALGDVVLNHRCAHKQNSNGVWNIFGGKLSWGPEAIVCDDPNFQGRGNPSSGDIFHAAPNVDHSQDFVRKDIKEWLNWLRNDIGFDGWRLDFVRGFSGTYVKEYIEASNPAFAIGEYWDSLTYEHGNMSYNQDAHRQRIVNWINATGGTSSAFDVTTKGILHSALHNEYWRLIDPQGKPTGVMGWWPSRAVTFLENHDTGSTQGHWPFPRDKLVQGYAYILTHPGTPVIFYDHFYDFGIRDIINELIEARRRAGVHCRSTVKIFHANNEGYVAKIGDTLVMKLGHFDWNPSKENSLEGSWQKFVDKGSDYQLWLRQ